jgi:hypothetical protein
MPEGTTSFVAVKDWAKKYISPENELRDAILMEADVMPTIEVTMKTAAYNNMLEANAKRIRRGNVTKWWGSCAESKTPHLEATERWLLHHMIDSPTGPTKPRRTHVVGSLGARSDSYAPEHRNRKSLLWATGMSGLVSVDEDHQAK